LWEEYVREIRDIGDRDLIDIIGKKALNTWEFKGFSIDYTAWGYSHYRIIGEFIRRHHGRIAHEVAIYGFPGLGNHSELNDFLGFQNAIGSEGEKIADLIGLVARSHQISLRTCNIYLKENYYDAYYRPMGVVVLYCMVLLRVADYLQIEKKRAPEILLKLKKPQSPESLKEWEKHQAIQKIDSTHDKYGIFIWVADGVDLSIYLQLEFLFNDLQNEMDHSVAVLEELYGRYADLGLNKLKLSKRRVYSNIFKKSYQANLDYVPKKVEFSVDSNLINLLIKPLYGDYPNVGIREILQNSVDAVRELSANRDINRTECLMLENKDVNVDVLIEFVHKNDDKWILRIVDNGIGMTESILQDYYLKAGASFRESKDWKNKYMNHNGEPITVRAGRYGIGSAAVFLLGSSFKLLTKYAGSDNDYGLEINVSWNSKLIKISKVKNINIGTTIEIELEEEVIKRFDLNKVIEKELSDLPISKEIDWFCWDYPRVIMRVVSGDIVKYFKQEHIIPINNAGKVSDEWFVFYPEGYNAVYWAFGGYPWLSCNGIKIESGESLSENAGLFGCNYSWPKDLHLLPPRISVIDAYANLPLTIKRDSLINKKLPFIDDLSKDIYLSFIAYILVCGPKSIKDALTDKYFYPLHNYYADPVSVHGSYDEEAENAYGSHLYWVFNSTHFVPTDPKLINILKVSKCYAFGGLGDNDFGWIVPKKKVVSKILDDGDAVLCYTRFNNNVDAHVIHRGMDNVLDCNKFVETIYSSIVGMNNADVMYYLAVSINNQKTSCSCPKKMLKIIKNNRVLYKTRKNKIFVADKVEEIIDEMMKRGRRSRNNNNIMTPDLLYACCADLRNNDLNTQTLFSKVWHECLGNSAVPFDKKERDEMIVSAQTNKQLNKYIKSWGNMKKQKSKWVRRSVRYNTPF